MKLELLIFSITALFVYNAYYDQFFSKMFHVNKKYITIFMYVCIGLSAYTLIKNKSKYSRNYLISAYNAFKHLPISKTLPMKVVEPIANIIQDSQDVPFTSNTLSTQALENRILHSGNGNSTKRSVSETKKNM